VRAGLLYGAAVSKAVPAVGLVPADPALGAGARDAHFLGGMGDCSGRVRRGLVYRSGQEGNTVDDEDLFSSSLAALVATNLRGLHLLTM